MCVCVWQLSGYHNCHLSAACPLKSSLRGSGLRDDGLGSRIAWVLNWQQIAWHQKQCMFFTSNPVNWWQIATFSWNKAKYSGLILVLSCCSGDIIRCSVLTRQCCCQPIHPLNKRLFWKCFSRTNVCNHWVYKQNMTRLRSLSWIAAHCYSFTFLIVHVLIEWRIALLM